MTTVLSITYAEVPGFPAGSAVANIVASVVGVANTTPVSQTVPEGTASVSFTLGPDTYTYTVNAVDASGAVLGTPVTGTFVVAAPATISLSLPSAVSVASA